MNKIVVAFLLIISFFIDVSVAKQLKKSDKIRILLVGDSVTAGMYFLSLSDESAKQGWAQQLLYSFGIDPDLPGFKKTYPVDNLNLSRDGFGFWGVKNIQEILPNIFAKANTVSDKNIAAIPGQTLNDAIYQSSDNHRKRSASWVFARQFLNKNKTFIESIENSKSTYDWIIVWLGSNDLLAAFGILGDATSPEAADYKKNYKQLIDRLSNKLSNKNDKSHLLILNLADVTLLPLFTELPEDAVNASGNEIPQGSKTTYFLSVFRDNKFDSSEIFTPEKLKTVKHRVESYNKALSELADETGATIVDINKMMSEVQDDPDFSSYKSPYFSPDLNHLSYKTNSMVMNKVLDAMEELTGGKFAVNQKIDDLYEHILPAASELSPIERKRANSLMRTNLQIMRDSRFPPVPSYRTAIEISGSYAKNYQTKVAISGGADFTPVPISPGWVSRLVVSSRFGFISANNKRANDFSDFFIGYALEPQGKWDWRRFELGLGVSDKAGWGAYSKMEWGKIYIKVTNLVTSDPAIEGGVRLGKLWGRVGHNGN